MRKKVIILAMGAVLLLSGCASVIELSSEEEDLIAEYAAQTLVKSYKENLGIKDNGGVTENETKETTPGVEEGSEAQDESSATSADVTDPKTGDAETEGNTSIENTPESDALPTKNTLEEALGITGVELELINYTVESRYPLEAYSFTVDANPGHQLLIVEYDVWNSVDADTVMEVDPEKASIHAVINGTEKVSVYRTMLKNDLLNMNGSKFKPGEAKTGVLIFSIKEELAEKITSVDVQATTK